MFDPKASKHPKLKTLASPKGTRPETTAIPAPIPSRDQIKERAYQLYESRGGQDGQDQQDWLTAEQQILNQHR
jgi:hypothetical protein